MNIDIKQKEIKFNYPSLLSVLQLVISAFQREHERCNAKVITRAELYNSNYKFVIF